MSSTVVEPPRYELFYHDQGWDKREIRADGDSLGNFDSIPVVDLTDLFSPDFPRRLALAREVAEICRKVGFLYVKNHGVNQDLIDGVFAASQKYHAQPLETKMRESVYKSKHLRGYDVHYTNAPGGNTSMPF